MLLLSWNCQGAASPLFRICAGDLIQDHNPDICVIIEPRISGDRAKRVIEKLGFHNYYREDSQGFSGGIWLMWNETNISVRILQSHRQCIHFTWKTNNDTGYCTAVYGSPNPIARRELWLVLRDIDSSISGSWSVIGDFNAILLPSEKKGRF